MNYNHYADRETVKERERRFAEQKRRKEEGESRERLNEAAPALLAACEWLLPAYIGMLKKDGVKYKNGQIPGITQAEAAIAKAKK